MKKKLILTYFSILFIHVQVYPQCGNLVWYDEFNGTTLDNTKWTAQTGGGGWGNAELQNYTTSTNNLRVENGTLVMEARNAGGNYTSSRITTSGKFDRRYGRFEMRAKLPYGTGLWPAFWLLPSAGSPTWPQSGEIDIMENRGDEDKTIGGALHYGPLSPGNQHDASARTLTSGNFNDNFHVFAVEWQVGRIEWFVDGISFKIETSTPNTLSPASNGATWPWDNYDFYILLNLAVGGVGTAYTGFQNPNFGLSGKYEIDYVRVYDASQPQLSIIGRGRVFENSIKNYSVPTGVNQSYVWTVPTGASITAGQGTSAVTVDWGTSAGGDVRVDITHNAGATCPGKTFFYTKLIQVYKNNCSVTLLNFEGITAMSTGLYPGALTEVNNPGSSIINSSGRTARYVRNGGDQYDALFYENCLLDNGTQYASATPTYQLQMDLYTNAPVGTEVALQIGNQAAWGTYPFGIHSAYTATTTVANAWQTLTFTYVNSPDGGGAAYQNNLDRAVLLFRPNSYTSNIYHFDNIRRILRVPAPTLTITGAGLVATSATSVPYSATGYNNAGNNFLWGTPSGASIASGNGTPSVGVDFGTLGGFITVKEQMPSGCYGPVATQAVSVGNNSCAIFADEFDNGITAPWLANSSGAGFTHTEKLSDWKVTSAGHGEWEYVDYTLNDGVTPILIDFTNPINVPLLKFRGRVATGNAYIRVTMVDDFGRVANNQYLNPINGFELTTTSQEFSIDFTGQLWDEYGGGGALDLSRIAKLRVSFNPGFASFPIGTHTSAFIGQAFIDYFRMGSLCPTPTANFKASDYILCGIGAGNTVVYTDNSISTTGATTYSWNFGPNATPATASTAGPHTVYYTTAGWKSTTLTLNTGQSTRTKTDYVYVSAPNPQCLYYDNFNDNVVSPYLESQGNFTFAEASNNFTLSTTGHGEWETFTLALNNGTIRTPIDFTCATTSPVISFRAKASSNVSLRLSLMDNSSVAMANPGVTTRSRELTNGYQIFSVNLTGLFTDDYSAGGPYAVDNTAIEKIQFRVNPGFSSSAWTGPNNGAYNAPFIGAIDVDYIGIGSDCTGSLPISSIMGKADLVENNIVFKWTVLNNLKYKYFEIQEVLEGEVVFVARVYASDDATGDYTHAIPNTGLENSKFKIIGFGLESENVYSTVFSVEDGFDAAEYQIAPNPFDESCTISTKTSASSDKRIKVFTIDGLLLMEELWPAGTLSFELGRTFKQGVYMVVVYDEDQRKVFKIIK